MNTKRSAGTIFAILAVSFVSKLLQIISPTLQSMGATLNVPYTSIMLVMTIPTLISIPVSLGIGFVAGRYIKNKTALLIGLLLMGIGGIAPYFLTNWTAILVSMGTFGVGQGIIMPMVLSMMFSLFTPEKQATMMGLNNTVSGISGMIFSALAGVLVIKSWNYPFMINVLAIAVFVIVLIFLPSTPKMEKPADAPKSDASKGSKGLPAVLWIYVIIMFVFSVLNFPSMGNVSFLFEELGLSPALAGTVVSVMTAGSMVSGIVFGKVFKVAGPKSIAIGFVSSCIGQLLLATGGNFALLAVGEFLVGFGGLGLVNAGLNMVAGSSVPMEKSNIVMSIMMTGMNVGMFLSPYIYDGVMNVLGITTMRFPFWVGLVGFAVLAVVSLLLKQKAPAGQDIPPLEGTP